MRKSDGHGGGIAPESPPTEVHFPISGGGGRGCQTSGFYGLGDVACVMDVVFCRVPVIFDFVSGRSLCRLGTRRRGAGTSRRRRRRRRPRGRRWTRMTPGWSARASRGRPRVLRPCSRCHRPTPRPRRLLPQLLGLSSLPFRSQRGSSVGRAASRSPQHRVTPPLQAVSLRSWRSRIL